MDILNTIKSYGCHDVVSFKGDPTPRHLDYLDLLKTSSYGGFTVDAVAEFQARPLLYIVTESQHQKLDGEKIARLQRMLANRGERAYLGILSPGELNIYPINLNKTALLNGGYKTFKKEDPDAIMFFQGVTNGLFTLNGQPESPDYVYNEIFELLSISSQKLIDKYNLNPLDVLSFLGRALFLRFLYDRKIILQSELNLICPQATTPGDCFKNVCNSVATSRWLDETFNGDLLPLSGPHNEIFESASRLTGGSLFYHLQAILDGWEHVGEEDFQRKIDWNDLDFAHIPIGVLSQVYESFSRVWDAQLSENTSVFYTPKNLARYLVDDAFEGIADKKNAQILDPSCGAGIFLVLTFRKLVAERWAVDGKRPNTKTIQDILYKQLCGFDVSESALRLAALSLYVTAIELNDSPRPPKSLKFPKPLQGVVLHNQRKSDEYNYNGFVLGSLRPDLPKEFNGRFDLVIGNPPWSGLKGGNIELREANKLHNAVFTNLTRQVLLERGLAEIAKKYSNPDNNPDLPFLWKSVHWAKPDGIIALALHARIFLKQTQSGICAFNAILKGIEITGILNGSNLSDTEVWPGMNQPFFLLFARNRVPKANHYFHFVTPHYENRINDKGLIRIDHQSAQPIATANVLKKPWLLKTLSMGTLLDEEVRCKLNEINWKKIKSYWKKPFSGVGYILSSDAPQNPAPYMLDEPDFAPPANSAFSIDLASLSKFKFSEAHRPREPELYNPPMLIVPESPGQSPFSPKSWIARNKILFNSSYYGFSAHGNKWGTEGLSFLHLITHSDLFKYHVYMTSSKMAAERRAFLKSDLENFPFPVIDQLPSTQRRQAISLSEQLESADVKPWKEINEFIFDLYGMDKYDRQVIKDTLEVAAPYKTERERANVAPSKVDRDAFYTELQQSLTPYFTVTNEEVAIDELSITKPDRTPSWYFFTITSKTNSSDIATISHNAFISQIVAEANKTGCSRVNVHEEGSLLVGIIGQYRYWTLSRARLCALNIIRHHLDVFPLRGTDGE